MDERPDAKRIFDLCDEALKRDGEDREMFLLTASADEPELLDQIYRLLKAAEDSGRFMCVDDGIGES